MDTLCIPPASRQDTPRHAPSQTDTSSNRATRVTAPISQRIAVGSPACPAALHSLSVDTRQSRFNMASDPQVGSLLRTLAATKPGGRFLEIGSGTGLSTAWLLDGMSDDAHLLTIDNDASALTLLQRHLGHDARLQVEAVDGDAYLKKLRPGSYDLIFADAWPGKYRLLDLTLDLLKPGGVYVVDDMLPQANWPEGHAAKVEALLQTLATLPGFHATHLDWATGVVMVTRQA